jgi:hypothetical protein
MFFLNRDDRVRQLEEKLEREESSYRSLMNAYHRESSKALILEGDLEFAKRRIKELEAEKAVILQAISGIGPTLLEALNKRTEQA